MNIEHKVTSLEWSQKLKACGFPQEKVENFWVKNPDETWSLYKTPLPTFTPEKYWDTEWYPAPDVCEIAEELPEQIIDDTWETEYPAFLQIWIINKIWKIGYENNLGIPIKVESDTLANALATMYCYLDKKKLLKQGG